MSKSNSRTHLGAARRHGRRALNELRHMTADSALYWVLSHRARVAQFKRSIAGTRAERPFKQLLQLIREESSRLERKAPRRRPRKAAKAGRRARARRSRLAIPSVFQPFAIG